ncbi:MAG: hypothetical protein CMJ18_02445 [Phycisphaeraceae bacterium]|nr:hypothetical protein [Phycisphaeraceae bacterium]
MPEHIHRPLEAVLLTPREKHFFFAYYDKLQFDPTDRWVLAQKADFLDRPPRPDDAITVGTIDLRDNHRWEPLERTTGWCWQQGCMLQWLPGDGRRVIHNVRTADGYGALIHDLDRNRRQEIGRPIYCVRPDAREAMGNDPNRVAWTRPGYGYVGFDDPNASIVAPVDAGLWRIDLERNEFELLHSIRDAAHRDPSADPEDASAPHWFNHLLYNTDGSRVIFLHRWKSHDGRTYTRMYTCDPDGGNLHQVSDAAAPDGYNASHFWWRDAQTIIMWGGDHEGHGAYRLLRDQDREIEQLCPALLPQDGHMTYGPPGPLGAERWILSDTYPDVQTGERTLLLYRPDLELRIDIGSFHAGNLDGEIRCDLHPRWSRSGRWITIDSVHEGFRGVYLLEIGPLLQEFGGAG